MTIWDAGWADQSEPERENQNRWEGSDDDLEADSVAPWRGEAVHPEVGESWKKYPGQNPLSEKEGEDHGDEDEE